jgi:hypothetical protein
VEVKYRNGELLTATACNEALKQAQAMASLLAALKDAADTSGLALWRIAFQHLLCTMVDFGFRVYSQKLITSNKPQEWLSNHHRVIASILSDDIRLEVDRIGRLVVFDASPSSAPRDIDNDGLSETIVIGPIDAGTIVTGDPGRLYRDVRGIVGDWQMLPTQCDRIVLNEEVQRHDSGTVERQVSASSTTKADPSPEPPEAEKDLPLNDEPVAEMADATPVPPAVDHGIRVLVGSTVDGFRHEERFLTPSNTALNQLNMGVVGDLGTGKTQLVKSLIYQISRSAAANADVAPRFLIFDYKRDYSSPEFVSAVNAKVIAPQHLPLNMFAISGQSDLVPWMARFKFFADVLDKIYKNVGPVQRENLKQAVKSSYEEGASSGRAPTIYDVHAKYKQIVQGKPDAPLSIIGDMVDFELFATEESTVPFGEFLKGVVVLSLDALGQDDRTKNMVVAIMLNMFYEHMLQVPKRPYRGNNPQLRTVDSYLLVDEADNIMQYEFDVLRKILLQGREFGTGVLLASQFLKHFKAGATDYREPLLTWFIHKVPNVTVQELSALGMANVSPQMADRIRQLGNHECLYKTFDNGGEIVKGTPFFKIASRE